MNAIAVPSSSKATKPSRDVILEKAEAYAHAVYAIARKLPKDELFGITSQLKRASLSVPLNIVEGHARQSAKSRAQFLKIAYGSLKESQFIIKFCVDEKILGRDDCASVYASGEQLAKLIWKKTQTIDAASNTPRGSK